jgi:hypothetical protein
MSVLTALEKHKENLAEIVASAYSYKQVCSVIGYSEHGRNTKEVKDYLLLNGFNTEHFVAGRPPVFHELIEKTCPVCSHVFFANPGIKKQLNQTTCSRACANSFFRKGKSAGNYINGITCYDTILNDFYQEQGLDKECVVCGVKDILDIHHADEDRNNNNIVNLVLLCPNHHARWHRYKDNEVLEAIIVHQDFISKL